MTAIRFVALPTQTVAALRAGGLDANGQRPENHVSDGGGNDCRHCLTQIAAGEPMLILAHRPFPEAQPYAEVGPIFLHGEACERHSESPSTPSLYLSWKALIVRGYGADNRIKYGSGRVVTPSELPQACDALLDDPDIAYLHLRSPTNNCYACRVERQS